MSQSCVRIGDRLIGPGNPCYVIAEVGVNHNGDLALAKELVDAAVRAGVDAVKFQKRKLSEVYQHQILEEPRRGEQGLQYIVPLLVEFELSDAAFAELAEHCRRSGVTFLCTPWDRVSVDFLESIAMPAYKIGSPDMTNFPLIEYVARTGKPLLMSTGMSSEDEIRKTLAFTKGLGVECALFHCVSTYPVTPEEINLRFMQRLREWSGWPVGYSGHEEGVAISLAAVASGAMMLERHITLDRNMRGPDHMASLEPAAFTELIRAVRDVELSLGVPHRWISRGEVLNRRVLAKSLVAAADIDEGTVITPAMVAAKSPGMGVSPQRIDQLIGRRLQRSLKRDELFSELDLREPAASRAIKPIDLGLSWGVVSRFNDLEALSRRFAPQGMSFVEMHLSDRDVDAGVHGFDRHQRPFGLVVHAPEYCHDDLIDLCAADDAQRIMSIQRIQKTIDLARELAGFFDSVEAAGPKVVVHVGGMVPYGVPYDPQAASARLLASVAQLSIDGIQLLLENLPPCPWYFGGRWSGFMLVDAAHTAAMCEASGLALCFDVSHAALACHYASTSLSDFTDAVLPYVRHLHLSDGAGTSGEGLQVGEGQIDFTHLWRRLASTNATCVPEIWMGHHDSGNGFQVALDRLAGVAWAARALSGVGTAETHVELSRLILPAHETIAAAMHAIDVNALGVVFVVDHDGIVVGAASDGDVRRGLLDGRSLHDGIATVMNRDYVFAFDGADEADIAARLSPRCRVLPILDSTRRLVSVAKLPGFLAGASE